MLDKVFTEVEDRYPIMKMFTSISGPNINPINGKTYYEGIVEDRGRKVKVAFDLKYVEYGKSPVREQSI